MEVLVLKLPWVEPKEESTMNEQNKKILITLLQDQKIKFKYIIFRKKKLEEIIIRLTYKWSIYKGM